MAQSIVKKIEINAPVDAVWKALIDDKELTRWLPLQAEVRPGQGGQMKLSWGDPVVHESTIEVWKPNEELKVKEVKPFGEPFQPADGRQTQRTVDYKLKANGNKTNLRLEHAGFGNGPQWDAFMKQLAVCWDFQLNSLDIYASQFRGQERTVSWARTLSRHSFHETWQRVTSAQALLKEGSFGGGRKGDRYSFMTAHGDQFSGQVLTHEDGRQFAGTTRNGLVRVVLDHCGGKPEATIWVATYHAPAAALDRHLILARESNLIQYRLTNLLQNVLH